MGTDSMIKMKIGSKLLLTYSLLIASIFLSTSLSFNFITTRYLIHETEVKLQKEAEVMSQLLSKSAISNKNVQKRLGKRKALFISEKLLSSKMIIWKKNGEIIYTDSDDIDLEKVKRLSTGPTKKFVTETVPFTAKLGKTKGYVTLIARLDDINNFNGLMRNSQFISLIISALIALLLGVFFEKSITKPIRMLTDHLKNYTVKGAHKEISINTKDEIKDLADSFNALSRKIKQYDDDQRMFFQNASHELKTPLMAIQGNAEGILDGVVSGEDVSHSLNVIIAESQRLKKIVESITYLAKLENVDDSFYFNHESLETIILEAVQSIHAIAGQKGIKIKVETNMADTVWMDKEKMRRAFINLLGNAIRYAKSQVLIKSFFEDGHAVIEIKDDGPGIAADEEKKIFQRFYSGEAGGSGMGLAITKAIIEGHGGTIIASNAESGGAVFKIVIPG